MIAPTVPMHSIRNAAKIKIRHLVSRRGWLRSLRLRMVLGRVLCRMLCCVLGGVLGLVVLRRSLGFVLRRGLGLVLCRMLGLVMFGGRLGGLATAVGRRRLGFCCLLDRLMMLGGSLVAGAATAVASRRLGALGLLAFHNLGLRDGLDFGVGDWLIRCE